MGLLTWLACADEPVGGWHDDPAWSELDVGSATAIPVVRAAGDVDGDGLEDLVVHVEDEAGARLLVFRGGADLDAAPSFDVALASSPDDVLAPGDLDADGFADVVACTGGRGFTMEVYRGSAAGLTPGWSVTAPEWARNDDTVGFVAIGDVDASGLPHLGVLAEGYLIPYEGAEVEHEAHLSIHDGGWWSDAADAGDFDGDGFDDLLALGNGGPAIHWGNPRGLELHLRGEIAVDPDGGWASVERVAPVGDVDGDGFPDSAMVGDGQFDDNAYLVLGGEDTLDAAVWLEPGWSSAHELLSVGRAGDQDGDGYDDVLVATPYADAEQGGLAVFAGGPDGLAAAPTAWVPGGALGVRLGDAFASGLDLDVDGFPDVVASAIDPTAQLRLYRSPWRP